ncbi:MAG: lipid-A-disaccharide synthase [Planctomycetes bacterium]|nr:lipid-A-disaccharide synthase [Planctomycetota bacterium]
MTEPILTPSPSVSTDAGRRGSSVFIVAGEESGDLHAADLVRELLRLDPGLAVAALGGRRMAAAGARVLYPLVDELAVMGFLPVLAKLPKVGRILDETYSHLERIRPDALILVDYPGFNLYLARYARRHGIPVLYYIVPQLWAWGHWRLGRVRRRVDRMLVIFPFEEEFYRSRGIDARFVGHPLMDQLARFRPDPEFDRRHGLGEADRVFGLLPGSRSHEIAGVLPVELAAARRILAEIPGARFFLGLAKEKHRPLVETLLAAGGVSATVLAGGAREIMSRSEVCLVTSGTATVETAWFGTPLVILYRIGRFARLVARSPFGIKTRHIGMVNILAGREVAPEFLMVGDESERVARAALALARGGPGRASCLEGLAEVRRRLDKPDASRRAAEEVLAFLAERAGR